MTEHVLLEQGITFCVKMEKGVVYGEPDLLSSVFLNLIDNAKKACGDGGRINWIGENAEGGYRFLIRDNGQGIPEDEIQKITEPFYMVDKSRARKEGGAGMGMALCQIIIQRHEGIWEIQSEVGKGTEIRVFFPDREEKRYEGK